MTTYQRTQSDRRKKLSRSIRRELASHDTHQLVSTTNLFDSPDGGLSIAQGKIKSDYKRRAKRTRDPKEAYRLLSQSMSRPERDRYLAHHGLAREQGGRCPAGGRKVKTKTGERKCVFCPPGMKYVRNPITGKRECGPRSRTKRRPSL